MNIKSPILYYHYVIQYEICLIWVLILLELYGWSGLGVPNRYHHLVNYSRGEGGCGGFWLIKDYSGRNESNYFLYDGWGGVDWGLRQELLERGDWLGLIDTYMDTFFGMMDTYMNTYFPIYLNCFLEELNS